MNHHEAQVIADAYRAEAKNVENGNSGLAVIGGMVLGWRDRVAALYDHATVWQRVADALKPPTFVEVRP